MKIRRAMKKDFSEIVILIDKEYSKPPYNESWKKENALKTLNYFFRVGDIFVLVENKKIIGFVISRDEQYNKGASTVIEDLVVDSEFQGKGYGKMLINHVESQCKKKKIKGIWLLTSREAPAFKFYKKMGYFYNDKIVLFSKKVK